MKYVVVFTDSCDPDYDVVFILDRSDEVGNGRYSKFKNTINKIIEELDFGKTTTWISIVAFDKKAKVLKYLNDNNNAQFVKDFVDLGIDKTTKSRVPDGIGECLIG